MQSIGGGQMGNGTTELDRPVPLYMQVVRQLRAQIAAGQLTDGDRLPSQREMMARWRISMQTASKVIGAMKTEGLAIPSVGRDTIVAPGAAARIAAAARGTTRATDASLPPEPGAAVTTVTAGKAAAPGPVAEILAIQPGRRALRRTETRTDDDGQPASVTVSWYPPGIADTAPALADSQPLPAGALAYIAQATGTRAARADEDHAAEPADAGTATALGISPGSPVLVTRTRHYAADGRLIEYAQTTMPGGRRHSRTYAITGN
jgi:DNA-binding GntR family transcriptional regulator